MIQILFDFEVDTHVERTYPIAFYERIRAFYLDCYKPYSRLIIMAVNAGFYPVMILIISTESIQSVPVNMPDFIARLLHKAVRQDAFNRFEEKLHMLSINFTGY